MSPSDRIKQVIAAGASNVPLMWKYTPAGSTVINEAGAMAIPAT